MFDVAVIGLGAMGSAAAYHLAKRGLRVVGFEQFPPAHDRGSSHGRTRVIRQAYYEDPDYVPLLFRAYELWRSLESETGKSLLIQTGGLMIGSEESAVVRGSLVSVRRHRLPYRFLSNAELRARVPGLSFRPEDVALYEQEAGVLFVEECILALQERARALGADLRFGVKAPLDDSIAKKRVITTGAWMKEFLPKSRLAVERQVMFWFDSPERIPLFLWDYSGRPFYGIPTLRGDGIKIAFHHGGETTDPDRIRRDVGEDEIAEMKSLLAKVAPSLGGVFRNAVVCMYTNTPDQHFAIGLLPNDRNVAIASACSGHGFKFAPVVGEILADLITQGYTSHPLSRFGLDRIISSA